MILGKTLLLKGLAGVTALAGSTIIGFGIKNDWWQNYVSTPQPQEGDPTDTDLIAKVGLECGTTLTSNGSDCSIKTSTPETKIAIKQDNTTFDVSTITGGKIKLYKLNGDDTGYKNNLKFAIEEGDINGTTTSNKLEQFETYEIEEVTEAGTKKYYLKRKSDAKEGIKTALGLPSSCNLPENTNTSGGNSCNSLSSEDLKTINFDGKRGGVVTIDSGGNATINITKVSDNNYPLGYKFTIQPSQKLTISTSPENSIAPNISVEFKIKKTSGTNQISLEKAWSLETLAEKVGLGSCDNNNECSIKTNGINVKHDDTKEDSKTKSTSSGETQGKIKVYKDASGYKEGFKFVIEDGDIALSNGSGTISKLEQFETYEIEEADGKYYLSRKSKAFKEISIALGLPSGCDELTNDAKDCSNLTKDKLKGINFEGKSNGEVIIENDSGSNIKLKVTKLTTSDTVFPNGYKFVLESDKKITIPKSSGSIIINKNTNTEFKIKVTPSSSNTPVSLSLEKAWTVAELAKQVGLTDCGNNKECTLPTNKNINVILDSNYKKENATIQEADANKKLKYEEDQEGYNQGIKFYVDDDINLEDSKKIESSTNSGTPSYEIKKDDSDNKWYLAKKTNT